MPPSTDNLGKLVSDHPLAAVHLQRAVFIVILSFVFFLGMMLVYYLRQSSVYFLLASAFLLVYIVTMFSFVTQRRNQVQVFENGFKYKKQIALWSQIESVNDDGTVSILNGKPISIPRSIHDVDKVLNFLRQKAGVK